MEDTEILNAIDNKIIDFEIELETLENTLEEIKDYLTLLKRKI